MILLMRKRGTAGQRVYGKIFLLASIRNQRYQQNMLLTYARQSVFECHHMEERELETHKDGNGFVCKNDGSNTREN